MRRCILAVLCVLALALPAAAQTRSDTAAVWLNAAAQLRAAGQGAAADALLELLRQRFGDTPAAAEAVRLLSSQPVSVEAERSGRVELTVWGTTYGLWLGVAVPLMAGADQPEPYGAGLLAGGPIGFFATRAYLNSRPVSEGQARAITFGGTWGTWQGFGWMEVLDPGADRCVYSDPQTGSCYEREGVSAKTRVLGSVVGGLAGIGTGAVLAQKPITSGLATTVSFGGLWGSWYGFALGSLANWEDDELLTATLVGGDAGLVTLALLAPKWNPTRNRARLVSLGGLVGLLGGLGLDLIIQPDDEDIAIAIPAATSAAGLLLAARGTRNRTLPPDRGTAPPGEALLHLRDGVWGMDVPAVTPVLQRERGRAAKTSLYVPLLQAAF